MATLDTDALLRCFAPAEPYASRVLCNAQWHMLRGEGAAVASGKAADVPKAPGEEIPVGGLLVGPSNFEVGGVLGEGNYSTVYQATLKSTQEPYALKVVDKSKCQRYKKQDEVVVEKYVLHKLRHPLMVRLFHTFQDQGSLYLALEFVSGGELWAKTHKKGLAPSLAAFYGAQMLEVLQFLHEGGVVHRDVKPENVLVDDKGHIKLIDFGTAKLLSSHHGDVGTKAGNLAAGGRNKWKEFVGTPEYMSPEAIDNKDTDYRADLWSFGGFLVQMLAGMPPFKGGSDYLTFKRVQERKFRLDEGFPPAAADLVERLLVLEPTGRLGGATEEDPQARHGAIRAHRFFDGVRASAEARTLHRAPLPMPSLLELCLPTVTEALKKGGWHLAALRGPPTPSTWPEAVRQRLAFELHRADQLTPDLRVTLALGPAPPPIKDDLEEFEGILGEDEQERDGGDVSDQEIDEPGVVV